MAEISLKELKDLLDDNELDLSARGLESIPKALYGGQMIKATNIDLSNNKITSLPAEFCKMNRITKLDLGNNGLVVLPDNFGDLTALQHLNLYNNEIEDLPLSFANLKLKWLDLGRNDLESALGKVAGGCANDKECKQAAVNVVAHLQERQKELLAAKTKQEKVNQKIQAANNEALKAHKEKEKKKKAAKNEAAKQETAEEKMSKHSHGHKHHNKAQSKAPEPEEKPSRGLFGFLFSLIRFFLRWSLIAGVCFALCATVALSLDCYKTGGGSIANSKGFCSDVTKMTKFKSPSERFVQNAKNAYGSVFNAYNKQFGEVTSNAQKSFNQFYKTSTFLKDAEAVFYKCHKAVTHYLFYVFTLISDAWANVTKWYEADGKKTVGFIVEPVQVAAQMGYEIAKDLFFVVLNSLSAFLVRATDFFERIFTVWAEKGFSAAIDAAFKH